jgi:mono/diheme cytochrome c family protein
MARNRIAIACLGIAVTACALIGEVARAQDADLHKVFEQRCSQCHGHAGKFARESLQIVDGSVVGSPGLDLERFLQRHKGGLPPEQVRALLDMFRAQIEAGAFFQQNCRICHGSAYDFARLKLIEREGELWGRYSDHLIREFLPGHAGMSNSEASEMTLALIAILTGAR